MIGSHDAFTALGRKHEFEAEVEHLTDSPFHATFSRQNDGCDLPFTRQLTFDFSAGPPAPTSHHSQDRILACAEPELHFTR